MTRQSWNNTRPSNELSFETRNTCVYNLSKVKFKFLGDKKGPTKGFYLVVWKNSVFLYQVYLLNYHNCFYICEGLYLRASHVTA